MILPRILTRPSAARNCFKFSRRRLVDEYQTHFHKGTTGHTAGTLVAQIPANRHESGIALSVNLRSEARN